jgi:UDP-glucose 4-epimerase
VRVLITGIAGFIGSHLADRLLADGHEVVGIDNLTTGRPDNVPDGANFVLGHIAQGFPLERAYSYAKPDVVYHCAANYKDPAQWQEDTATNVLGTCEVLKLALRHDVRRIVYFQTSLCYGLHPDETPIPLSHPLRPSNSYAISKTAGEQYIAMSGLEFVSLRLANIYGPRNLSGPIPTFYKRLAAGQPCTVVDTRRDFVYIDDLIRVAAAAADSTPGIYHVASGRDYTIRELYDAVADAMGATAEPAEIPRMDDDAPSLLHHAAATRREFGWKPVWKLADGVAEAVAWYEQHGVGDTYTHLTLKG